MTRHIIDCLICQATPKIAAIDSWALTSSSIILDASSLIRLPGISRLSIRVQRSVRPGECSIRTRPYASLNSSVVSALSNRPSSASTLSWRSWRSPSCHSSAKRLRITQLLSMVSLEIALNQDDTEKKNQGGCIHIYWHRLGIWLINPTLKASWECL